MALNGVYSSLGTFQLVGNLPTFVVSWQKRFL